MKKLFLLMVGLMLGFTAAAQTVVSGTVLDEYQQPLIGANVLVPGTTQGTTTDVNGTFTLNVGKGVDAVQISFLNYKTATHKVNSSASRQNLGTIAMEPDAIKMDDVVITQSIAVQRKTPVAVSTVSAADIEYKLGSQEFPEILKATPGVYATKEGGGYGDSKINLRGFKSENIAVMVNGVPMNDMEGGAVYWSNWAGLSDVTRTMQVQRGLGASKVSNPSVGGSINIVTNTIDAKKGGSFAYGIGNDGMNQVSFSFSTGLTKNGWAASVLMAKRWGDGYVQGTDYDAYTWFVNVSKRLNDRHQLSLTAFGSPQEHYQRPNNRSGLSIVGYQQVTNYMKGKSPYRYNPVYGFGKNGERKTSNYNSYHKPQISLNHQWQIDHKSALSTALYMSIGRGYGFRGEGQSGYSSKWYGATDGVLNMEFRNADGTRDYAAIQTLNEESTNGSKMVIGKNMNEHEWYGIVSTYTNQIHENLHLTAGVDARYYIGHHTCELQDLFNGAYYMDTYYRGTVNPANNAAAADPEWRYEKLGVGDVVYRDYDGHVHQEGIFGQLEWSKRNLNAFVSGTLSHSGYWRVDRFYYDDAHKESETSNHLSGSIKFGANWNLTEKSNIFANFGYLSLAPKFNYGVFLNSQNSHAINPDATNEKVLSAELGYGFRSKILSANINAYYTEWRDKTTSRTGTFERGERQGERYYINMTGVDARHMGIELEFTARFAKWIELQGMLSWGDWEWASDAKGYYYDMQGQPLADLKDGRPASGIMAEDHAWSILKQKGIKVGGSAQTTASLGLNLRPIEGIRLGVDWVLHARNYSDYSVSGSNLDVNSTYAITKPWEIPYGHQFDLFASYNFKIGKDLRATVYANINNVFNQEYIVDAYTPAAGPANWESAYGVFYNFGRTISVKMKLRF
ncbi:MAG: TonB-dependent receptor [Alistipes sp.]|nr:TonB-dependent receptor [Alistipes sp.]